MIDAIQEASDNLAKLLLYVPISLECIHARGKRTIGNASSTPTIIANMMGILDLQLN